MLPIKKRSAAEQIEILLLFLITCSLFDSERMDTSKK